MSDPHEPEEATRESSGSGSAVSVEDAPGTRATEDHDEAEDTTTSSTHEADVDETEAHDADDAHETDDDTVAHARDDDEHHDVEHDDDERHDDDHHEVGSTRTGSSGPSRQTFIAVAAVAVGAVIAVLVLLAAFVWPDFTGPGKPDDTASQAVSALSAKDPGALDRVGCKRSDGKPSVQLPPQILQLIQSATPSGPPKQTLTSEARQTINLTLSAQGQAQSAPVDMVFAVNDGAWCLNNIEAGQ